MPPRKQKIVRVQEDGRNLYATPALEKGLDVLELLAHCARGLTKSEISRQLNRTISEIFRMLLCLERRGYIAQAEDERYWLTLKLFRLVQEHPPTRRLIAESLPVMHRLAQATRQSCHLGVVEGAHVTILAQVHAPGGVGFYVRLGSAVDLLETATGYVVLAHQDAERRDRALAEWTRITGHVSPPDLPETLRRIREQGHEIRPSYKVKGITNISYPIFDERGSAACAMTIPYLQYMEPGPCIEDVSRSLRMAAGEITAILGGRMPDAGKAGQE
jgi:DNA-binding IclR family transcriptional regulator